jgi:hypothetical protein
MRWRLAHTDTDPKYGRGHRLFVDLDATVEPTEVPRIWVADNSGPNPSATDDGPLEIDQGHITEIFLEPSHGFLVACVPVLDASGNPRGVVHLSAGCARYLADAMGVPLGVKAPYLPANVWIDMENYPEG